MMQDSKIVTMTTIEQKLTTAVKHHQAGDLDRAQNLYREVVRLDPSHADALHLLGVAALQNQQHETAVDLIQQAIAVDQSASSYHCNLGTVFRALDRLDDAVASFREAIRLNSSFAGAHYNLAMALDLQKHQDEAVDHYREAIRWDPEFADAYNNLGNLLSSRKETDEAISCFRKVVQINSRFAAAYYNLANALHRSERLEEAVANYRRAIRLQPQVSETHNNLGVALKDLCEYDGAVVCIKQAIQLNPNYAEAYSNLGSVRQLQGKNADAIESFQKAVELSPNNPELLHNLASTYRRRKQFSEAIECFQQMLEIDPNHAVAHYNLAMIYEAFGDLDSAKSYYEKALELEPVAHRRLQSKMMLMPIYESMSDLQQQRRRMRENIEMLLDENFTVDAAQKASATGFYFAYQGCEDRPLLEQFSRLYRSSHVPVCGTTARKDTGDGRIRVGFASRYFKNHTIGRLMRGLIARLSRKVFHVTVLSVENDFDEISQFIRNHADDTVDLTERIPEAIKRTVNQELDILFYSDIGMDPVTYALAHNRLAPVQCVSWGHPVTTAMNTIDYFLSSELAEPENAEQHYTEQLVRLKTLPTYYYRPQLETTLKTRKQFGLPEQGAIYLCPQSLFKIHPEFDAILSEILRRDPNGYIALIGGYHQKWTESLIQRFQRTIPDGFERILFLPRQPYHDFHNLIALCDVMLDPIHFGGGNTNYEAMAFGTPVVTLPSQYLRGRVALALYRKMGLADCVANTFSEYVDIAVNLGTHVDFREQIRERILESCDCLFEEVEAVEEIERFLKWAVMKTKHV